MVAWHSPLSWHAGGARWKPSVEEKETSRDCSDLARMDHS
jgi:hypothetical protein